MKKITALLTICIVLFTGCGSDKSLENSSELGSQTSEETSENTNVSKSDVKASSGDVIEIKEKMFISQTNDVYYNTEDYLGKTIKMEGIFNIYEASESGNKYYSVIRYGPGCCGDDGNAGFEVTWDGKYPNQNDWVEVIGVLEEYEEAGETYLQLRLNSLTVLTTRGEEYVNR